MKVGRKVDALVFSPNGKLVAEGPDSRGTVEIRDTATHKVSQALSDAAQPRVPFSVAGMVFADAGKTLAFGNGIGLIETIPVPHRIHFWDVTSGKITDIFALSRQVGDGVATDLRGPTSRPAGGASASGRSPTSSASFPVRSPTSLKATPTKRPKSP